MFVVLIYFWQFLRFEQKLKSAHHIPGLAAPDNPNRKVYQPFFKVKITFHISSNHRRISDS
jgi:hypothetical protein